MRHHSVITDRTATLTVNAVLVSLSLLASTAFVLAVATVLSGVYGYGLTGPMWAAGVAATTAILLPPVVFTVSHLRDGSRHLATARVRYAQTNASGR